MQSNFITLTIYGLNKKKLSTLKTNFLYHRLIPILRLLVFICLIPLRLLLSTFLFSSLILIYFENCNIVVVPLVISFLSKLIKMLRVSSESFQFYSLSVFYYQFAPPFFLIRKFHLELFSSPLLLRLPTLKERMAFAPSSIFFNRDG